MFKNYQSRKLFYLYAMKSSIKIKKIFYCLFERFYPNQIKYFYMIGPMFGMCERVFLKGYSEI